MRRTSLLEAGRAGSGNGLIGHDVWRVPKSVQVRMIEMSVRAEEELSTEGHCDTTGAMLVSGRK